MSIELAMSNEQLNAVYQVKAEHGEELCVSKEESDRRQQDPTMVQVLQVRDVHIPPESPGPGPNQKNTEGLRIKEEPEEPSFKQEEELLLVSFPECRPAYVKKEVSSPVHQAASGTSSVQGTAPEPVLLFSSENNEWSWCQKQWQPHNEAGLPDLEAVGSKVRQTREKTRLEPHLLSETDEETEHSSDTKDDDDDWEPPCSTAPQEKSSGNTSETGQAEQKKPITEEHEKRIMGKQNGNRHMDKTVKGLYMCSICQRVFPGNTSLNSHIRVHTGEKPFSCEFCERTFTLKGNRDRHMELHAKKQPHGCKTCGETFLKMKDRDAHVKLSRVHLFSSENNEWAWCQKQWQSNNEAGSPDLEAVRCKVRQTRDAIKQEKTRLEPHLLSETDEETEHSSDTKDDDDDWEPPCSTAPQEKSSGNTSETGLEAEQKKPIREEHEKKIMGKQIGNRRKDKTGKGLYMCSICQRVFPGNTSLNSHMRVHTGEKPFSCEFCERTFTLKGNRDRHMELHSKKQPHGCKTCGETFLKMKDRDAHVKLSHGGGKPYDCSICDKAYRTKGHLDIHMRTHSGEKPYSCATCGKSFRDSAALYYHTMIHTGGKPHGCSYCDKVFAKRSELTKHERVHTGEKPFVCTVCSRTFSQSSLLRAHVRIHTGEKPYSCTVCSKSFRRGNKLQVHMRTHTGERPYSCPHCHKAFMRRYTLKAHVKTHTARKHHLCPTCGLEFASESSCRRHERTHTGEKPHRCPHCDKTFARKSQLDKHLKTHQRLTSLTEC